MLPTDRRAISEISEQCTDPTRADQMMLEAVKMNDKLTRAILLRNFLQKTQTRGLGTQEAVSMARGLTRSGTRTGGEEVNAGILHRIMKLKIEDANKNLVIVKRQKDKKQRELRDQLPPRSLRQSNFFDLLNRIVTSIWETEGRRLMKKLDHLTRKMKKEVPDIIEGVKVGDAALGPNPEKASPLIWGGERVKEMINEEMKAALNMPPNTTMHEKINLIDIETNIEIMNAKVRWELKDRTQHTRDQADGDYRTKAEKIIEKNIQDPDTGKIDMTKLRVSQLKTKRDVIVPEDCSQEEERRIASLKEEVMQIMREYISERCDDKGKPKDSSFPKEVERGIKDLGKLCKEEDLVVFQTDKSNKLSVNTRENYLKKMDKHTEGNLVITNQQLHLKERLLNHHTLQTARALGVGRGTTDSQAARLKAALLNQDKTPPILYGTPKDHKPVQQGEEETGPPTRPICGAKRAPNGQLSDLLVRVLDPLCDLEAEELGTESRSTEDMIASLDGHNRDFMDASQTAKENLVVGSMDVKALYPSINIEEACEAVQELVEKYCDRVEGAVSEEAARYLALVLTEQEQKDHGLHEVLPQPRTNMGMRPGITSPEVTYTPLNKEVLQVESKLGKPAREPSDKEKERILAVCLATATRAAMGNHVFQLGGVVYSQEEGLPMGNPLTGVLARIMMLKWDKAFCTLVDSTTDIKRSLHKRYVDDHMGAYRALEKGARWDKDLNQVVYGTEEEANLDTRPPDTRTMDVVRAAANTINDFIQFTSDTPSNNNNGKLPVLDIQCWVEGGVIYYKHYRKPVSTQQSLLLESALPARTKRTVQSQEVVRILRNCHPQIPREKKADHLTAFMRRLRASGYSHSYRAQILMSGIKGHRKMTQVEQEGGRPVNRPDSMDRVKRKKNKIVEAKTWYRRGGE